MPTPTLIPAHRAKLEARRAELLARLLKASASLAGMRGGDHGATLTAKRDMNELKSINEKLDHVHPDFHNRPGSVKP